MLLIIDSSQRLSGNNCDFSVKLQPAMVFNTFTLKYASITNANGSTDAYNIISIGKMDHTSRGSDSTKGVGQFIVPRTSVDNARNIYRSESDFKIMCNGHGVFMDKLDIRILSPSGAVAADSGFSNVLIFELE